MFTYSTKVNKKINKLKTGFIDFVKHPLVYIPLGSFILILSLILSIYHFAANSLHLKTIPNSKIVIISHDGEKQVVPTTQKTVGDLLKVENIVLNPGDVVEPGKSTVINQDDFRINIYRGKPVKVVENGNVIYATSAAATPRAIAIQAGIQLYAEDNATTNPSENILSNGAIGAEIDVTRATPFSLNMYGNTFGVIAFMVSSSSSSSGAPRSPSTQQAPLHFSRLHTNSTSRIWSETRISPI